MRALVAAVLMGLLTGCGSVASRQPAATSASPSPAAQPASEARTPPPFPLAPLTHVDFACRLPITTSSSAGFEYSFIDFPSRKQSPTSSPGYVYYDAAVGRWLPAPSYLWSPDGRQYATTDHPPGSPTRVRIVDAATGTDSRVFTMPNAQSYFVLEFTTKGVELAVTGPGVWRLDPATGHVVKVSDGFYAPEDEWIGTSNPGDVIPSPDSGYAFRNPADRIGHRGADGTVTPWFYMPGRMLLWLPFVGSQALLVEVSTDAGVEYWLVNGPNRATRLASYSQSSQQTLPLTDMDTGGFARAAADAHGIWLGGGSIYLITASGAIERVDDHGGFPAGICA